jgi:hypothetical protein
VVAGGAKLRYRSRFLDSFAAMELFPHSFVQAVSILLPPVEIVLGIAVFLGWKLQISGSLVLALLCCFILVLAVYRLNGGVEIVCGCFADFDRPSKTSYLILRAFVLFLAGLPLVLVNSPVQGTRSVADYFLSAVVVCGILITWALVLYLLQTLRSLAAEDRSLQLDEG